MSRDKAPEIDWNNELSSLTESGGEFNCIGVDDLFEHYKLAGFLYKEKERRLSGHWETVINSWKKAMSCGERLLRVAVRGGTDPSNISTVTLWRHCDLSWMAQHLTSTMRFKPIHSLSVMKLAQTTSFLHNIMAGQLWYQPGKKFGSRIFGSIADYLGSDKSVLRELSYYNVDRREYRTPPDGILVEECFDGISDGAYEFARNTLGKVFDDAEELGSGDLNLKGLDDLYREVGLRRYRRVFLAYESLRSDPVGLSIVYRGPLGLNFSLLENRCELILSETVRSDRGALIASALLDRSFRVYEDFEANPYVPNIFSRSSKIAPIFRKGSFVRHYNQCIWLNKGFLDWYRHIERQYEKYVKR